MKGGGMKKESGTNARPWIVLAAACVLANAGCGGGTQDPAATYRIMSLNVLCSVCDFEYDPWEDRVGYFGDIIKRLQPDVIGFQELILGEEVDQVIAVAPGFAALYFPGTMDVFPYPDAVIAYRTERFDLIESGEYWLSPTPDEPGTMGFSDGQDIPRLVAWAHLHDKTFDRNLYFATTHFDAVHPHQEKSVPLVLERTAPWAETMPVAITGDFNLEPFHDAFDVLITGVDDTGFHFDDTYATAQKVTRLSNTATEPDWDPEYLLDHVLVGGGNWTVAEWIVDLYKYGPGPKFPSDHRAIMAVLEI